MAVKDWFVRKQLTAEEQKRKTEEAEAIHRGRIKYLERQASKTGKAEVSGGGFGNFLKEGVETLAKNASSSSTHSMFDSPTFIHGGGFGFDPIYGGKRRR